ncbi:MAG: carboxypeptidase regulatory-like domain-containing protein [Vicinamibacterales bacterium]
METRINPLRLLIVVAITAAIGVKALFWLRDGGRPARGERPTGTATVAGLVSDADGRPMSGAEVRLQMLSDRSFGWRAATGADGTFTMRELPAGEFYLRASKHDHLETYYGEAAWGVGRRRVVLDEGGAARDLHLTMTRAGRITGTIADEAGRPAPKAFVRLQRLDGPMFGRTIVPPTTSGADGRFEITGVPPGDYLVRASIDPAGNAWTYYPSADRPERAEPIRIGAGGERTGVDVRARPMTTTVVRGRVSSAGGTPVSALVRISGAGLSGGRSQTAGADGRFTFDAMPPGVYDVVAYKGADVPEGAEDAPAGSWGQVDVMVDGEPVEVAIHLEQGVSFDGRIEVLSVAGRPRPVLGKARISMDPADEATGRLLGTSRERILVRDDGTFRVLGVPAGRYRLSGFGAPGWISAEAHDARGRALQFPFEVVAGDAPSGVVLTLADETSRITGVVRGADGEPAADRDVVVFPADPEPWRGSSGLGRLDELAVQVTQTDGHGRFTLTVGLAGDYLVAVVPGLQRDAWYGVEQWADWAAGAVRVAVAPGARAEVEMRVGAGR